MESSTIPGAQMRSSDIASPQSQAIFVPLVVDELDTRSRPSSPFDPAHIKGFEWIKNPGLGSPGRPGVIGSLDLGRACPCCRRYITDDSHGSHCNGKTPHPQLSDGHLSPGGSISSGDSAVGTKDAREDDLHLPGSLRSAVSYDVKEIIAQGWVHKKGTGKDWLGSRAWKPRWSVLALASVPEYEVDVPLLLIYWWSSSEKPSNVIILSNTVVMPVDRYKTDDKVVEWNTFAFEVVHTSEENDDKVTRVFSVPEKERNEWVYEISQCLLGYEKRLKKYRSIKSREALRAVSPPRISDGPGLICHPMSPGRPHPSAKARQKPPCSPRMVSRPDMKPPLSPYSRPPEGLLRSSSPPQSLLTYSDCAGSSSSAEDSLAGLNINLPNVGEPFD